ncbi:MAG: ABC transporter transmembrane domain-containing protein [Alphaproteobacteria bacterium]|nr:ABC transporter transmembrane domain-containing protein [Alphaproteobacteria bacterium]
MHAKKASQSSYYLIKRLFAGYLKPHLGGFIVASIFMAVGAATTGGLAKMIEPIVNELGKGHSESYILGLGAIIVGIFAARGFATYWHTVIMNKIGQRIVTDVQQELHRHLLRADLSFFHSNPSGELIMRLTNDVGIMRQAVGECMTSSFKGGLTLIFLIGVMFYQDWRLSLASFFVFPLSALFVAQLGKHMRRYSRKSQEETGKFASLLSQIFLGMRHVKAYGMEKAEHERVQGTTEAVFKLAVKGYHVSALANPMAEMLSGIAIMTVILYGNWQIEQGHTTTGALLSFITAFVLAFDPMKRTAKVNSQLQSGLAAAERVFQILDMEPKIVNKPDAVPLQASRYDVSIENVVFHYINGKPALQDVSITVPHGKTVALVGPSGAGKSTIINLIPRFYDVQQGRITIGGMELRDLTMQSLRSHLALVSQETALFDDTIRANIAYGRPEASLEDIEKAAEDAFADGFIAELPAGYDTVVGECGVKLSGGQRQRIAIARAMLRNAPILLLDEATSALDNESERAVQAALKRLQKGRTTIVVAHRLSTIVDADQIIVLDQGKVVEKGTHDELLALGGVYAKLYGMQGGM